MINMNEGNSEQRVFGFGSKAYGVQGIVGALFLAILLPVVLSMLSLSKMKHRKRAVKVDVEGEPGFTMRNSRFSSLVQVPWDGATSVAALFEQSCKKHADLKFLGCRKLIKRDFVESGDGRKFEKLHLGEYEWQTYRMVFDNACNFGSGLINLGQKPGTCVAIFADTRAEWFIALQGCLRQNITVVTIYASLGEDALVHSLNETQISTLICDSKQLKKLHAIHSKLDSIRNVVYFEDDETDCAEKSSEWKVLSFNEVTRLGKESPPHPQMPSSDDVAVIMYTSGSTGLPKGVMITHGNIVATTAGVMTVIPGLGHSDIYLAYLPLAHVFELASESVMMAAGAAIGYGSALTLTDTSNKIMLGTKGDASALKPTLLTAVPAILDRIRDGVSNKVKEKGGLSSKLFNMGYTRRLKSIEGSWLGAWGLERVLWDVAIFKSIRSILGGNIRFILSGGAPLSRDTQRFINVCVGVPVGQGYGLTETFAGATFSEYDDPSVGRVGPPLPCSYVKLISWEDGGYTVADTPMPRGEVVVGGYSITKGYFNNEAKTNEVFKDEGGIRWFYTGDIGQFHPDGCLEIIDRKKDIVKLQHGEYVSLGKVEAALAASDYVQSIMVYADPFHSYCVALVVPPPQAVEAFAQNAGIQYNTFADLCQNDKVVREVQQSLVKVAKTTKLEKFEIPSKVSLLPDPWTPESGLVTAAMKLKREQLKTKFKHELQKLYE